jgi:hypothetical protein
VQVYGLYVYALHISPHGVRCMSLPHAYRVEADARGVGARRAGSGLGRAGRGQSMWGAPGGVGRAGADPRVARRGSWLGWSMV